MKYVAFRIDDTNIKETEHSLSVVHGWFIRGQRETDYNWPLLGEAETEEEAVKMIISRDDYSGQMIYNPGGYGIYEKQIVLDLTGNWNMIEIPENQH